MLSESEKQWFTRILGLDGRQVEDVVLDEGRQEIHLHLAVPQRPYGCPAVRQVARRAARPARAGGARQAVGRPRGTALNDETVKEIDREILERKIAQAPKGCATLLGVDEISQKKGHVYMSAIVDLQSRRVIGLEEGCKAHSL